MKKILIMAIIMSMACSKDAVVEEQVLSPVTKSGTKTETTELANTYLTIRENK